MAMDVSDQTFGTEVLERSKERPVIVDLWAPWCGPCRTLGPILEAVVAEHEGDVELKKVNVDDNPQVAQAFAVQSIPAVYALRNGEVVDGFMGALPEAQVRAFVDRLIENPSEADELVAQGDEASLRAALELEPDHAGAITALAELLVGEAKNEEALALLARLPESAETRRIAALARLSASGASDSLGADDIEDRLKALLDNVRSDDAARQEYVDILEAMDPEDPRREPFRKMLSARLF